MRCRALPVYLDFLKDFVLTYVNHDLSSPKDESNGPNGSTETSSLQIPTTSVELGASGQRQQLQELLAQAQVGIRLVSDEVRM